MIQQILTSIRQDGLLRGVIKSSAHLFSGNVVAAALSFLQGILVARLLGMDGYGLVSGKIIVFVSSVNTLLSFRMSETVVRFVAASLAEGRKEQAAATIKAAGLLEIAATLFAYAVLLLLAPWAAVKLTQDAAATSLIAIYGLSILGNLVYETSTGVLRLARRFDRLAQITLAQSVLTFGLIAWAYFAHGGVADVLAAYLAGKLLAGIWVAVLALRQISRDLGSGWWRVPLNAAPNRREMLSFSINTNLNGTLNLFTRDMVPLYLGYFSSNAVAGYFRLAQGLINLVMLPIEPFIWPTYTEITRTIAARQWAITRRLLKQVSVIAAAWVFPAGIGLALFGSWLIPLLYTPAAAPAYPAAIILVLGYGFATIFQWNRPLLLALGEPGFPVKVAVVVGIVEVALMLTLTPQYGYLMHAAILSGFFIISIGINVWHGLSLVNQQSTIDNRQSTMKIACITTVRVPATTANSVQVMKACAALGGAGQDVQLWVPEMKGLRACPECIEGSKVKGQDIDFRPFNCECNSPLRASSSTLRYTQGRPFDPQTFYGLSTPFPVLYLPARSCWKRYDFCWNAVRAGRRWGAQAVYTWALQAAVFALLLQLPVLLEMHGPPEGALGPLLFRLFLALPGKKRILPISQALVDILTNTYHVSGVPCRVSPNGVELERFANLPASTEARRQLGFPEKPTVGYTGHFYAGRGMNLMTELARRLPEIQFLWVGGKPEDVASWRSRLDVQGIHNVILAGFVENQRLPLYQAAADVLMMPYERRIAGSGGGNSAAYCSPMKMFEYMACGRAIISSDLPVIGEVLNNANAVRCPPEDADAWVQAITDLLNTPARRTELAQQALSDVQRYTWLARARRAMEGFL